MSKISKRAKQPQSTVRAEKPRSANPRGFLRRIPRIARLLIAFVLGVATLAGYVAFVPVIRVGVPSSGSDPKNPFNKPFVVNNEGNFSVYSLKATCGAPAGFEGKPTSGAPTLEEGKPAGAEADVQLLSFSTDKLEPHVHRPFTCGTFSNITFSGQLGILTRRFVTIRVDFKPIRFIPWHSSRQFSFEALPQEDGYFHWSEIPLVKDAPSHSN